MASGVRHPNRTRFLVPVNQKNIPHSIKYLVLQEEPKGYICEEGCFHKYQPEHRQESKLLGISDTKSTSQKFETYTQYAPLSDKDLKAVNSLDKKSLLVLVTEAEKDTESPPIVATHYIPPGKGDTSMPMLVKPPSTPVSYNRRELPLYKQPKPIRKSITTIVTDPMPDSIKPVPLPNSIKPMDSTPLVIPSEEVPTQAIQPTNQRNEKLSRKYRSAIEERQYNKDLPVFTRLYPYRTKMEKEDFKEKEPSSTSMDWTNYHRLDVIYDFMDELERLYPSLCTVGVIGQTREGRDIKLLRISNGNTSNVAVWMDAGIHAREWIGPAVNTYIADHIARNFNKLPQSCTNKDWYFLPVANPDGYEYSHTVNRMWRKNRARCGGKCVGVDINRNFSLAWGGEGSSGDPHHCFYRGTQPFSEPESQAIRDVIQDANIPFKVYLTLHAFGEVIIFPFAHSHDLCPDYVRLLNGATVMSRAIYNTNGTTYKVGVSKDVMYIASGTSNDWCYGTIGIPYCYLLELRSKKHKFQLPEQEIKETSAEILNCVKALMAFVDVYPLQNSGDGERKQPSSKKTQLYRS